MDHEQENESSKQVMLPEAAAITDEAGDFINKADDTVNQEKVDDGKNGKKRSFGVTNTIQPRKRVKKAGFDEKMFEETSYIIKKGLRHIRPYPFTFSTHCKGRWIGKQLIQVYETEFRMETVEYYRDAIKTGKITVNGQIVEPSIILKHNDLIRTKIHRHEQPVVGDQLEIIENNEDLVVINKPSTIPVHPCGRFRHNTVVFILGKEFNLTNLHTIHRIDRLTSGILMFAKRPEIARRMEVLMKSRQMQKIYLCKVVGDFPSDSVVCEEPMLVASHNVGVCRVDKSGKPCKTEFKKVHSDGKTSILKCYPYTGRMHQIRVHLQWLGYPIVNDPIYNHPYAWGPSKGKNGTDIPIKDILKGLADTRKDKRAAFANELGITNSDSEEHQDNTVKLEDSSRSLSPFEDNTFDPDCSDCKRLWESLSPDDIVMFLHAWHYRGPDWEYTTRVPDWCNVEVSPD